MTTLNATSIVDINLIHRLTNLADINRLLHETVAKEHSIDHELDRLLSKRTDLERSFLLLNTPTSEVGFHADHHTMFDASTINDRVMLCFDSLLDSLDFQDL